MTKDAIAVFAVLRIDLHQPVTADGDQPTAGEGLYLAVTVKEILPTLDESRAEVKRLNSRRDDGAARYIWQHTRYLPAGRLSTETNDS